MGYMLLYKLIFIFCEQTWVLDISTSSSYKLWMSYVSLLKKALCNHKKVWVPKVAISRNKIISCMNNRQCFPSLYVIWESKTWETRGDHMMQQNTGIEVYLMTYGSFISIWASFSPPSELKPRINNMLKPQPYVMENFKVKLHNIQGFPKTLVDIIGTDFSNKVQIIKGDKKYEITWTNNAYVLTKKINSKVFLLKLRIIIHLFLAV